MALTDTDVPIPRPAENGPIQATGWLAGLGAITGLGALAASSCCALPLALAGLGAGSAVFGGLEILANWRPLLLGVAVMVVLAAWGLLLCGDRSPAMLTALVLLTQPRRARGCSLVWAPCSCCFQLPGTPTLSPSSSSLCDDAYGDPINIDLSALQSSRVGNDANGCLPVLL